VSLTLVLAASMFAGPGRPGGTPADDATLARAADSAACVDVLVLGADGDNETPAAGATFGPTLETFYAAYAGKAEGSPWSVAGRRISFRSQPVKTIANPGGGRADKLVTRASANRWRDGYAAGVRKTVRTLRAQAAACPAQQLVLAGYSQGAVVMHRSVLRLDRSLHRRITGVVLVGDGDRARRTGAKLSGAPRASRTGAGALWLRSGRAADLPLPGMTSPVWQVCTSGDVVCDLNATRIRRAMARHHGYKRGDGATLMRRLAGSVWGHTIRHPKPTEDPFRVEGEVGQALRVNLPVDVRAKSLSTVRWKLRSELPAGLVLDQRGVLAGTPTQVGSFSVRYTVRNVEKPEYATQVPGVLELVIAPSRTGSISAGGGQTCSVRGDQTIWCWGRNDFGQLGNGTTTRASSPVQAGTATGWASVTTEGSTTCATKTDGSLWCWGLNYKGQLGIGSTAKRTTPTRVGTARTWATVSNSYFHTCATRTDGSLWCWGFNRNGQLGDGTTKTRTTPVRVGTGTDWSAVTAGGWHTCATKHDGSLWCWGDNAFGQLGTGNRTASKVPVAVAAGSAWTSISASWVHTCGVLTSGGARCWGRNEVGQLGDGTTTARRAPTPVAGSLVLGSISTGESSSCGLGTDGTAYCWGANEYGELGDGTTSSRTAPAAVLLPEPAVGLDAGWVHACAVAASGNPMCWGSNEDGQLGNGSYLDAPLPRRAG
jgi:alpha-tubulin suppressor-like RCC1 family protein